MSHSSVKTGKEAFVNPHVSNVSEELIVAPYFTTHVYTTKWVVES